GMNGLAQGRQLLAMIEIARKQNHATHQRIAQALALMMRQHRALDVHHHGAGRQACTQVFFCHGFTSVKFSGSGASASITTKAATVSVSSVTETWALPKRSSYQLANGPDNCTLGLPPGSFKVCMRDHVMGLRMPRPMALENASLAAKRVAR